MNMDPQIMKYLTLKEIQLEELKIAKIIAEFCDSNNIDYYLSSGTLLGSVRHGGFIPWDDDMDLYMLRDDYAKFCKSFMHKGLVLKYCENGTLLAPFAKVYNPDIVVERAEVKGQDNSMLWVDIFPLDGILGPGIRRKLIMIRIKWLNRIIYMNRAQTTNGSSMKRIIWNKVHEYYARKSDDYIRKVAQKISHIRQKYPTKGSIYILSPEFVLPADLFENRKKYKFEDTEFYSVSNADKYLTICYGDYNKLPPENQRVGHAMKAYFRTLQ